MIQKIRQVLMTFAAFAALVAPVGFASTVMAVEISDKARCGADLNVNPDCTTKANEGANSVSGNKLNGIIALVINIFSIIVGVIAVIMIIISGLKYITSGGDSNSIVSAKNTIIYAVVGLVIVALAQFIVRFVLSKVSGATDTTP